MVETARALDQFAQAARPRVESALADLIEQHAGGPPRLNEAIRYSLLAPAKRLRPLLTLMAAEACGAPVDEALPAACAVEMIHTYSLIHDDLPAMDDDDLRRGQPTCHKVFGEALAILTGDALLTLAFEVLARHVRPAEAAVECCTVLASAAGPSALVGGQADDLAVQESSGSAELLEAIHARKTGALFIASLELGTIVAGADRPEREALRQYGRQLGLAFQITDDLLDVRGSTDSLGKQVGKDSTRGKLTFPAVWGIDESARKAEQLIDAACSSLTLFGPAAGNLEALARYVMERDR